jgi:hypothetical protein
MRARALVLGLAGLGWTGMLSEPTWAQTNSPPAAQVPPPGQAPVGHRQPTAKDVPSAPSADQAAKDLEKQLAKKLSICRGC